MVTNKNEALRSRRLPVDGQQRPQIILVCHARQPGEQVFQESQGILAMTLTGHDQGVEDRGALAGVGVTDKQPVLLSDARGTDCVLDEVIVEPRLAKPQMLHQGLPLVEQVIARSAQAGFGPHALSGPDGQALQPRFRS